MSFRSAWFCVFWISFRQRIGLDCCIPLVLVEGWGTIPNLQTSLPKRAQIFHRSCCADGCFRLLIWHMSQRRCSCFLSCSVCDEFGQLQPSNRDKSNTFAATYRHSASFYTICLPSGHLSRVSWTNVHLG